MLVYISGAITGTDDYMERFATAEQRLISKGYSVINPAKICSMLPEFNWYEYMTVCVPLLKLCDYIYVIDGISIIDGIYISEGVRTELRIARQNNIETLKLGDDF